MELGRSYSWVSVTAGLEALKRKTVAPAGNRTHIPGCTNSYKFEGLLRFLLHRIKERHIGFEPNRLTTVPRDFETSETRCCRE
jgi:hypothetical protein